MVLLYPPQMSEQKRSIKSAYPLKYIGIEDTQYVRRAIHDSVLLVLSADRTSCCGHQFWLEGKRIKSILLSTTLFGTRNYTLHPDMSS